MADGQETRTRVSSVMDDPSARAIARVYATALVDAAANQKAKAGAVALDVVAPETDHDRAPHAAHTVHGEGADGIVNA